MASKNHGNQITVNALAADSGKALINRALDYVRKKHGWRPVKGRVLFKGVFYDSRKVGSWIIRVKNSENDPAVLKIQLRPLPFDEGFIIRHIDKHNASKKIRTLKILHDLPWDKNPGFGYVAFKDESHLKNLWEENITAAKDRARHKSFLKEFFSSVLPIKPWLEKPAAPLKRAYLDSFRHFEKIARQSRHRHIENAAVGKYKKIYLKILEKSSFAEPHFTHGHLSGKDIRYDPAKKEYILMANLYWSLRPKYHELAFPIWVDLMHVRDKDLALGDFLKRADSWNSLWKNDLYGYNPLDDEQYWFNLLERAMMTIMLDLGAGEWGAKEKTQKEKLLAAWQGLFDWIFKNKFRCFS